MYLIHRGSAGKDFPTNLLEEEEEEEVVAEVVAEAEVEVEEDL